MNREVILRQFHRGVLLWEETAHQLRETGMPEDEIIQTIGTEADWILRPLIRRLCASRLAAMAEGGIGLVRIANDHDYSVVITETDLNQRIQELQARKKIVSMTTDQKGRVMAFTLSINENFEGARFQRTCTWLTPVEIVHPMATREFC